MTIPFCMYNYKVIVECILKLLFAKFSVALFRFFQIELFHAQEYLLEHVHWVVYWSHVK